MVKTLATTGSKPWPGKSYPLGASLTTDGVNFALFSANATGVDLCLFDRENSRREVRIRITERTDQVWHIFIPELKAGQAYGFRVYGPYHPKEGQRFNPSNLLLDPYAKAISGGIEWSDAMFSYALGHPDEDLKRNFKNNADGMPHSIVVDTEFDWGDDAPPRIPIHDTVFYELHVKGFTQLLDKIPEKIRGTYAGLATPEAIEHYKYLGVNAIELLPVHHFVNDQSLVDQGLTNYWGYNSIGYFAPDNRYSSSGNLGEQVAEFKQMVKTLHAAGIEVILDVVYNHTAEGNHLGPTLCFRGIDNLSYYRLTADNPRYYMDYTGCGNTLNSLQPRVLQLVMDSLRYWVEEMHVDGFRFDLAPALARDTSDFDRLGTFFGIIHQDPVLSRVKLIAEPWDLGENGYQLGNFPHLWAEWNGKYRDTVRGYWKGDDGLMPDLARRLSGSPDLHEWAGKPPGASVNFLTAHDGFTLQDLVSYNDKHNGANGEDNRDGTDHNISWNCGAEGPTDDPEINTLRRRQRRNFLATLFLSQGVPMLCAGDEYGRTQQGNNNTYCQDNELSWLTWERDDEAQELMEFTAKLIHFRHAHPVFRRPKYLHRRPIRSSQFRELMWFSSSGQEMKNEEWDKSFVTVLGMFVSGRTHDVRDEQGNIIQDDAFLLLFNPHHETVPFVLPSGDEGEWQLLLNTFEEKGFLEKPTQHPAGESMELCPRSFRLLQLIEHAKNTHSDA